MAIESPKHMGGYKLM